MLNQSARFSLATNARHLKKLTTTSAHGLVELLEWVGLLEVLALEETSI
jgi:hypothetical protein